MINLVCNLVSRRHDCLEIKFCFIGIQDCIILKKNNLNFSILIRFHKHFEVSLNFIERINIID